MNATDLIAQYIKLRDFVAKRSAEHSEELAPYAAAMKAIENAGAEMLITQGGDEGKANIATPAGTMFRKRWTSIKVVSRPDWMQFITEDWAERQKFLTAAVAKTEVEEWIETNKAKPPGIDIDRGYNIQFNKPKA
jgi:hypothetical protein